MLSDILPTGFECGVLNGKVQPGAIARHRWRWTDRIGRTIRQLNSIRRPVFCC